MKKFLQPEFLIVPNIITQDGRLKDVDGKVYGACYWYQKLKDGVCKASNVSIAKVVNKKSSSTIKDSLTRLEKYGYIKRYFNDNEKRTRDRIECLVGYNVASTLPTQTEEVANSSAGGVANSEAQSNNILNKNINTNVLIGTLPQIYGKTYILRLAKIYSILWKDFYGFDYKYDFATLGRILKPLMERYTEYQIASLIVQHFNWYGAGGDDKFTYDKIMKAGFQLTWIPNSANIYEAYIRNSLGINFDDPHEVEAYVKDHIDNL